MSTKTTTIKESPLSPEAAKNTEQKTIYIDQSRGGSLFGLGAVISVLLVCCAWAIVGIGYLCVPGSLVAAVIGIACASMNVANGFAAAMLCLGCGIACAGLCYPIFLAAQAGRLALLKKPVELNVRKTCLIAAIVIAVIGAAVAGGCVLAGGAEALYLPEFLQSVF